MKTKDFPYFVFGFEEFNQTQAKVIPKIIDGYNLVVACPPGTGKTAIAEAAYGFHFSRNPQAKSAYVCPFRALGMQKLKDWQNSCFKKYGVCYIGGDSKQGFKDIDDNGLSIFTSESYDIYSRHTKSVFSCVCFDEAHLVGDEDRGARYESGIINSAHVLQLILLSGTMPNPRDLGVWIKGLTGNKTCVVNDAWTKNKVGVRFHYCERNRYDAKLTELIKGYRGEKTIVFVHSRQTGKEVLKRLRKSGFRCCFHHGRLKAGDKDAIERLFLDGGSGLDIVVATSTLSAGINS